MLEKNIEEYLRYLLLIVAVFFANKILEHYVTINFIGYNWIFLIIASFLFYFFAKGKK